jgi:hypothetical protein
LADGSQTSSHKEAHQNSGKINVGGSSNKGAGGNSTSKNAKNNQ